MGINSGIWLVFAIVLAELCRGANHPGMAIFFFPTNFIFLSCQNCPSDSEFNEKIVFYAICSQACV